MGKISSDEKNTLSGENHPGQRIHQSGASKTGVHYMAVEKWVRHYKKGKHETYNYPIIKSKKPPYRLQI